MDFKILGPIEVRTANGQPIALGRRKQRVLLAALLLNAGKAIPTHRMLDWLWGEHAPANAESNLYTYISALRRVLGSPSRIEAGSNGYVLRVAPGEIDVRLFEELAAQGRLMLSEGRNDVALERCTRALGLWRAEAVLEGLSLPEPLRGEAARLERLRTTVMDASLEARLALGQHGEALPDLEALTRRDPLNERLRAQLMLALYRSGRRADALAVYQRAREMLAAELGVDPGPDLIRMHQQILVDDSALAAPSPSIVARRVFAPAELPIDSAAFTGRAAEVSRLRTALISASPGHIVVSAVAGAAGIGKSAFAVHVAHQIADRFPDGQLYVNLHGSTPNVKPLNPAEVLARLLRSLGGDDAVVPTEVDEAAARFRSLTDGKHLLFLFDNARDAAQVRPLLPASPTCCVLITARRMLTSLDAVAHLRLDVMAEDEMITLLSRLIGDERVAADPWAARAIVRLCGGLPLAIRIAAARLIARPGLSLRVLADRLAVEDHRLSELQADDRAVRACFMVSYRSLDAEHSRMFRLLGLLGGSDISVAVAAALANRSEEQTANLLDHLADVQLLEVRDTDRYRMHDLLCLFARERTRQEETEEEQVQAVRRALHSSLVIACALGDVRDRRTKRNAKFGHMALGRFNMAADGFTTDPRWLNAKMADLISTARQVPGAAGDGTGLSIVHGAVPHQPSYGWGGRGQRGSFGESPVLAAGRPGDRGGEVAAPADPDITARRVGPLDEPARSSAETAAFSREAGDPVSTALSLGHLAETHRLAGRPDMATLCYHEALEADLAGGTVGTYHMAEHWWGLGRAYQDLGDNAQARECWRTSAAILHALHLINSDEKKRDRNQRQI
ncbi:NB-ARC domain-containing protein [Streptosporangium sp. NBC_01495]|uniref:AfsR/SARP family transcriptional regulator n=1 Tax=Streptosporangium sp. NBC_01495 TaxID=2903899 RepID=UPI002E3740BB|nr:BTAD domain-containing putative transcriptional regulator [Streptosporangium sp. NBC_01495]